MPKSDVAQQLVSAKPLAIPHYEPDTTAADWLLVKVPYAKATIADTSFLHVLRQADVVAVHLLFTDFPAHQSLQALNAQRFRQLFRLMPALEKSGAEFLVFRQMEGNSQAAADTMLHGFAIQYRKKITEEERKEELTLIEEVAKLAPAPALSEPETTISQFDYIYYNTTGGSPLGPAYKGRPLKFATGNPQHAQSRKKPTDSLATVPLQEAYNNGLVNKEQMRLLRGKDSVILVLGSYPPKPKTPGPPLPPLRRLTDSSLLPALRRQTLRNTALLADVTGSMAPFTAQVLQWLSQVESGGGLRWFGCFNDGNGRADAGKEIGRTGGIFIEPYEGLEAARALMRRAMQAGNGGDLPENVVEALQRAELACPSCAETVLVADAWAPARDIAMASQLTKPVRVLVCGRRAALHPHYLTIAALTGGSLHFSGKDYTQLLDDLKKGSLVIEGQTYEWKGGQAVRK